MTNPVVYLQQAYQRRCNSKTVHWGNLQVTSRPRPMRHRMRTNALTAHKPAASASQLQRLRRSMKRDQAQTRCAQSLSPIARAPQQLAQKHDQCGGTLACGEAASHALSLYSRTIKEAHVPYQ